MEEYIQTTARTRPTPTAHRISFNISCVTTVLVAASFRSIMANGHPAAEYIRKVTAYDVRPKINARRKNSVSEGLTFDA